MPLPSELDDMDCVYIVRSSHLTIALYVKSSVILRTYNGGGVQQDFSVIAKDELYSILPYI